VLRAAKLPVVIDKTGKTLNLHRERVRQIATEALNKLERVLPQTNVRRRASRRRWLLS
jgi:DNA-directed RNA polymerase sigma subunit (sigma70/sigma32)